jgi:predicted nucleic acid-binding protein
MERKINERLFRQLPDATDIPHAVSAKIWGCEGIVAYDDHFAAITDVLEHLTPEQLLPRLHASQE